MVERGLRDGKRTSDGVRLSFRREEGLKKGRESECCAFFSFDVDVAERHRVGGGRTHEQDAYLEALYRAIDPQRGADRDR